MLVMKKRAITRARYEWSVVQSCIRRKGDFVSRRGAGYIDGVQTSTHTATATGSLPLPRWYQNFLPRGPHATTVTWSERGFRTLWTWGARQRSDRLSRMVPAMLGLTLAREANPLWCRCVDGVPKSRLSCLYVWLFTLRWTGGSLISSVNNATDIPVRAGFMGSQTVTV